LEVGAELAELVEEEGAAAGLLEGAGPARHCTCEGAFDVAEELGLDEVAGDGGAVEDDEGGLAARALLVDGLGDELFACAGAACDEQGDVCGGDALELAEDLTHEEAASDEVAEAVLAGDADLDLVFGGLEADAGIADDEGGAGCEPGLCDAGIADAGAILAGEVAEAVAGCVDLDGAVAARDGGVVEDEVVVEPGAEEDAVEAEFDLIGGPLGRLNDQTEAAESERLGAVVEQEGSGVFDGQAGAPRQSGHDTGKVTSSRCEPVPADRARPCRPSCRCDHRARSGW
jgi:hypothetical protein